MRFLALFIFTLFAKLLSANSWTDPGKFDTSWYNDLSTTFNLNTPEQFAGFIYLSNNNTSFQGKTINLTSDIDMGKYDWVYCNNFSGELNGNGYCVSNIHYKYSTTNVGTSYATVIRTIGETGIIHNIKFDNISLTVTNEYGQGYAGGITCFNYGIIHDCEVIGDVVANYKGSTEATFDDYFAGGIAACNYGTIINCLHNGAVESLPSHYSRYPKAYAGGIVGSNEGVVANCINYGSVYARVAYDSSHWNIGGSFPSAWAGGICGSNTNEVQNVINFANVTSTSYKLGTTPGSNAHADGICPKGTCKNSYYSSASSITAPSISKNGMMLSPDQLSNRTYDFTGLLNSNTTNITSSYVSCWGNAAAFRNNESFLLNNINIGIVGQPLSQNSIFVEATPNEFTSDAIIEKGFEYSMLNDPTVHRITAPNEFSSEIIGLSSSTKYKIRAYIKTKYSTIYSKYDLIQTSSLSVETLLPSDITPLSAKLNGKISIGSTPILSQGFLWKESQDQNYNVIYTEGSDFSVKLDGLNPSTIYFCQAFVVTQSGQNIYGHEQSFTTPPLIISLDNFDSNVNSLNLDGHINIPISTDVIIEYRKEGTSQYINRYTTSLANGEFSITLNDLDSNAEYEIRAYIIYNNSYVYSSVSIVKLDMVGIFTLTPLLSDKIVFYGESNGNIQLGEVGFEYREVLSPDIIPSKFLIAIKDGYKFHAETTDVNNYTHYKVRAYFKSVNDSMSYGDWIEFTPTDITSVTSIETDDTVKVIAIYDINGRKIEQLQQGFNIVVFTNGMIRKLLVK